MKLQIIKRVEQRQTIEIEFPYYYKNDLLLDESDCVIYGKIEENQHSAITIQGCYQGGIRFELETEKKGAASLACYMTDEYKSNETEYLAAKAKLLAAAQEA